MSFSVLFAVYRTGLSASMSAGLPLDEMLRAGEAAKAGETTTS